MVHGGWYTRTPMSHVFMDVALFNVSRNSYSYSEVSTAGHNADKVRKRVSIGWNKEARRLSVGINVAEKIGGSSI